MIGLALLGKLSELELMKQISRTDDMQELNRMFSQLYDSVFPKLWSKLRYVYSSSLDETQLKDAFQDGWRKILMNRKAYNEGYKPFNWIYTIMNNAILDFYKKENNDNTIFVKNNSASIVKDNDEYDIIENIRIDDISIDERIYLKNTYDTVLILINEISDDIDRSVIYKRLIEDKGLDEIAKESDIPLSTVNYRINKVLKLLRPKLRQLLEL